MIKKVLKYGTGQKVPEGAVYLCTLKNGSMRSRGEDYKYVWHYFLVEVTEKENNGK